MTYTETGYDTQYDALEAQEENDAERAAIFPEMTDAEMDAMFATAPQTDWSDLAWESRRDAKLEAEDMDWDARRAA